MKAAELRTSDARLFAPGTRDGEGLFFEKVNSPKVMSPWEMRCHLAFTREKAGTERQVVAILDRVEMFIDAWAPNWARFGRRMRAAPFTSNCCKTFGKTSPKWVSRMSTCLTRFRSRECWSSLFCYSRSLDPTAL